MIKIQHFEVGAAGQAAIEFTVIPQIYTDLRIMLSARSSNSGTRNDVNLTFNSDASSSYAYQRLIGYDSNQYYANTGTGLNTGFTTTGNGATANTFGNTEIYIPNYRSYTTKSWYTNCVSENNSGTSWIVHLNGHTFANTLPISSIRLDFASGSFMQYSSATLYGITAGSDGLTVTTVS